MATQRLPILIIVLKCNADVPAVINSLTKLFPMRLKTMKCCSQMALVVKLPANAGGLKRYWFDPWVGKIP